MQKFELPKLPYSYDALAPMISAETLHYHHDKHHRAYVDKLNELLPGSGLENEPLEEIIRKSSGELYNQAGQHWNHSFYWNSLTPKAEAHQVHGKLEAAIRMSFNSFARFKAEFTEEALKYFGSGWMWLVKDTNGGPLQIMGTPDGDTPLYRHLVPLFCCDLWEHAYYVDYRNDRESYLYDFWNVINWDFAEKNFLSTSRYQAPDRPGIRSAPRTSARDIRHA